MMLALQGPVPPVPPVLPGSEMSVTESLEGSRPRLLEEMPPEMAELEGRVDFTERIVAKTREPDRLHQ